MPSPGGGDRMGVPCPRLADVGDRTGVELVRTLQQKVVSWWQEDRADYTDYEAIVAVHVALALADRGVRGVRGVSAEELLADRDLCSEDLALLGLGSLDWIALATRLEAVTGVELPDHVLLEPAHRCVRGWAQALSTQPPDAGHRGAAD